MNRRVRLDNDTSRAGPAVQHFVVVEKVMRFIHDGAYSDPTKRFTWGTDDLHGLPASPGLLRLIRLRRELRNCFPGSVVTAIICNPIKCYHSRDRQDQIARRGGL